MNREKLLLAAGCAAFVTAVATAQPTTAPAAASPGYKNLQALPKDIGQAQLFPIMKSFAQGLGVRCTHCHVGTEGQPLSTFDFASDAKPTKLIARAMLAMVHRINSQEFDVADMKDAKVTCFTCHRGSTKPLTAPPPDANLVPPPPPPAPKATERG